VLLPLVPLPEVPEVLGAAGALAGLATGVAAGVALDELEDSLDKEELALDPPFLLLLPEYRSPYQPPPLRMKFPWVIWRLASCLPHLRHSLIGSSLMR
jgi:hypothetical protein